MSWTLMERLQAEVLPQSSLATQVRVTVYSAGQEPGVVTSEKTMETFGSQASEAKAGPKAGTAGQLMGDTTAGHVIEGAVMSCTLMERLQAEVLPQSSLATQVRVTVYSAGQEPGVVTSLNTMVTFGSQASLAEAAPKVGTAGQSMGDTTVGQVMEGGVMSCTTMVWLQEEVLPQSSVAT